MRVVMFYHSLLSDWNHGNAHFLRGTATELSARGHRVTVYEPDNAWSLRNLLSEHGDEPIRRFQQAYPILKSIRYAPERFDLEKALDGADLVLVHEWNDHALIRRIGQYRARNNRCRVLFHDTHHRSVTDTASMAAYDLRHYDGVLAFGRVIRDLYLQQGWTQRAWTWHEAADTRVFHPLPKNVGQTSVCPHRLIAICRCARPLDLVWIGNWGDEERTVELREFLIEPVGDLRLKARVHGVRYPDQAIQSLADAGIEYGGWLPNFEAPQVFAQSKLTVHVPRRPYVASLPGIPTIRVFEALACGIPLVSAPWDDVEGLFTPGRDYLIAHNGRQMKQHLHELLHDEARRDELAAEGLQTILSRHTCAHRVDELLAIYAELGAPANNASARNSSPQLSSAAAPVTVQANLRSRVAAYF